jgi:hypothetical protein
MTARAMGWVLIVALSATAASAAKPEIVQVTPNTYLIFKEDHKGIFGNLAKMKVGILRQANEFAAQQGKALIPLSCREKPLGRGPAQWATFEYQFRLVAKDDPEAARAALGPCPDVVVQSSQSIAADVTVRGDNQQAAAAPPTDLYADLLKLDDLRKRGLLSDPEFESEKRKRLSAVTEAESKLISEKLNGLYGQLLKLDDLHKRGILSSAEFEAEKAKAISP